jgi:hypothetical protein
MCSVSCALWAVPCELCSVSPDRLRWSYAGAFFLKTAYRAHRTQPDPKPQNGVLEPETQPDPNRNQTKNAPEPETEPETEVKIWRLRTGQNEQQKNVLNNIEKKRFFQNGFLTFLNIFF